MAAHVPDDPWLQQQQQQQQHGPAVPVPYRPNHRDSVESLDLLDGYAYADSSDTRSDSSRLAPAATEPPQDLNHIHYYDHDYISPRRDSSLKHRLLHQHRPPAHAYSQSESIKPSHLPPSRLPSPGHVRSQTADAAPTSVPALESAPTRAIKRKPLSSTASPLATRFYSSQSSSPTSSTYSPRDLPKPETRFSRAFSIDSPTLYDFPEPGTGTWNSDIVEEEDFEHLPEPLRAPSQTNTNSLDDGTGHIPTRKSPIADQTEPPAGSIVAHTPPPRQQAQAPPDADRRDWQHDVADDGYDDTNGSGSVYSRKSNDSSTMSIVAPKPTPPHLNLEKVEQASDISTPATTVIDSQRTPELNKPLPKSPSPSKFGTFFGWAVSPSPSTTEFSSLPSPLASKAGSTDETSFLYRKGSKANASSINPLGFLESNLLTPPPASTPSPPAQIQEMEDELKAISAELAASIRREMDLEDLVDRLQSEISNPQAPNKRTSDYFSDSGVSSTKFSEYDQNKEEVEKIQRRAEQEKASITLELTNKVQEERAKRKALDNQIRELSERASRIDLAAINSVDANGRVRELENTCEDLRRRLSDEKKVKNNFEDLLSAIRGELEEASNERDNLRDEVVPQLKARVEGLEAEASEYANLTYESTKMQQELANLKTENKNLRSTTPQPGPGENSSARSSIALSRSNSMTAAFKAQRAPNGLSRSNTVKGGVESREALAERLKDVEAQRDALHNALRNLLERQEFQNRENEKKIKSLEIERERLLTMSPGKAGFERDVSNLRNEVKVLRRRAEDAVEHKWQVEKGLAGLKMDLDRAEGEIAALRALLEEKDILIPPSLTRSSTDSTQSYQAVTSESLSASFHELHTAYQQSLEKIKALESDDGKAAVDSEKTQLAMQRLEQALASATAERDAAVQEAAAYKTESDGLHESEAQHVGAERELADELRDSARRIEELATQVRQQLASNSTLRQRLSDAVARGDADRKSNVDRITSLQGRLRSLEEQLFAAQTASEERVARHEEQIKELKDANNVLLTRGLASPLGSGAKSPRKLSPLPSPMFPTSPRSPRRLPKMTVEDEAQVDKLRARVSDLERALAEADTEMQDVIARMSSAQIEVMTLQEEREAAVRQSKKLQRIIDEERVKAFEDRFRSLSGNV